jgi:ChrR Cupin-like domain
MHAPSSETTMDDSTTDLILQQALDEPLNEADRADLNTALTRSPKLLAELAEFQAAAQSLAYAAPLQPMADLKLRLFARVGSTRLSDRPEVRSPELAPLLDWSLADLAAAAASLDWQSLPGMDSGETAIWRIDRATHQVASFVRAAGRDRFPAHCHASGEVLLVVHGDFCDGDRTYSQGDVIASGAQSIHQPTTNLGCLVLSISDLDDRLV